MLHVVKPLSLDYKNVIFLLLYYLGIFFSPTTISLNNNTSITYDRIDFKLCILTMIDMDKLLRRQHITPKDIFVYTCIITTYHLELTS